MKRFLLISSSVLLPALLLGLYSTTSVSAASIYDDSVQLIDPLFVPASDGGTGERNYSLDWYNEALAAAEQRCNSGSPSNGCQIVDDLENLLDDPNANWAVTYHSGALGYYIIYSFDLSAETNIGEFSVGITGNNIKHVGPFTYRPNDTTEFVTDNKTRLMNTNIGAGNIAISQPNGSAKIFLSTFPVTYPTGYEGETIPDTWSPPVEETLYPDYSWNVTKDENGNGILRVQYMDNLPHFLTGTSYLVVDKMTEKWGALDNQIASLHYIPAGWADWSVNLGDQPIYIMFRVDHNQQLDDPPWIDDINYTIGQVYYQIYWDGEKAYLAGTTIGCDGTVCNQFETEEQPINSILGNLKSILDLNIDTGLTNIVVAPIEFIKTLPTKTCSPINAPLPFTGGTLSLPCLKPIYDEYAAPIVLMWQVILTSLVSFSVATKVFAKLRETYNPRQNRIEVTNL